MTLSGNLAALVEHLWQSANASLNNGGAVYGAAFITPKRIEHIRAVTPQERNRLCGSKYVQSNITYILQCLQEDLQSCRPVLFSGTPCQCAAVAKLYSRSRYPNLILCDFACHGVPSPMLWEDYLKFLEVRYQSRVLAANFRDKADYGWQEHVEKITLENRTVISKRFANLFCGNNCLRPACYRCQYVMQRVTEITVADFWGIDKLNPEFNDDRGISLILLRTESAIDLFSEAADKMNIIDCSDYTPSHYNLKRPTACPIDRQAFWSDYFRHGFTYVSQKYGGYNLLRNIKRRIFDKIPD